MARGSRGVPLDQVQPSTDGMTPTGIGRFKELISPLLELLLLRLQAARRTLQFSHISMGTGL
jgi:hypothetical protein